MYTRVISKSVTPVRREIIRRSAKFYADKLMTARLHSSLTVYIHLVDNLLETEDVRGDCVWVDAAHRGKEFEIRVAYNPDVCMKEVLETLAHEMVHVKQFARGEMRELTSVVDSLNWNGSRINTAMVDYWDLPWEIEAHGRERGLFTRLCLQYPDIVEICGVEL